MSDASNIDRITHGVIINTKLFNKLYCILANIVRCQRPRSTLCHAWTPQSQAPILMHSLEPVTSDNEWLSFPCARCAVPIST